MPFVFIERKLLGTTTMLSRFTLKLMAPSLDLGRKLAKPRLTSSVGRRWAVSHTVFILRVSTDTETGVFRIRIWRKPKSLPSD